MQWILQDFEDTRELSEILERLGLEYSMHKVVPFVGELEPEPQITDSSVVVMFGSYSLRHYARRHNLVPGVFVLRPFLLEEPWHPHMLNGPHDSQVHELRSLMQYVRASTDYFIRPLEDSKEIAGAVMSDTEIQYMVSGVMSLQPHEYIGGSLRPETKMILSEPKRIRKEWRNWIVNDRVVTSSLYKEGSRVVYREEIDADALEFVREMVRLNPGYSRAYIIDVCRTDEGLKLIETNCINAAGFYAADLFRIVEAIESL